MQSPRAIWPLAISFDNGCTSRRSIARFKCRAPYLESVPSKRKNSLAVSVTLTRNAFVCGSSLDTLLHHLKLDINNPAQFLSTERFENYDVVQTVNKLRREL